MLESEISDLDIRVINGKNLKSYRAYKPIFGARDIIGQGISAYLIDLDGEKVSPKWAGDVDLESRISDHYLRDIIERFLELNGIVVNHLEICLADRWGESVLDFVNLK